MVSYKISDLTQTPEVDDNDYVPVVVDDGGAPVTNRATFETIKEYITGSVVNSLSASVLSGSATYSTTLTGSYITGNDAKFISLSGNLEWSYIQSTPTTTDDYGITDAVTINDEQTISGRKTFDTHYVTASITGSDAKFTTISASSITANEYNVVTINRTTLSQEGSTKFGDDDLDTHQFSGSVFISGNVSGSDAKFVSLSGNLDWSYIVNEPSFLTSNQAITLSGDATGSGTTTISVTNITASYIDWADVDNAPSFLTSNEVITLTGDATGSGTTSISITNVSASFIKVGTDGSGLTSLTASQIDNFSSDVRSQFSAGQNITISSGQISSTADVNQSGTNTFTGVNTFNTNYITGSITGSDAKFISITASNIAGGTIIGNVVVSGSMSLPIQSTSYTITSNDTGKTLLLSSSAIQAITCSSGLSTGFNCTFIQMGSGQLVLSGAPGVTLLNRQNHTGSAGQYAAVSIVSIDNDLFIVAGDTA